MICNECFRVTFGRFSGAADYCAQTATNRRVENVEPSIAVNQSWNEAFSDLSGVVKNEMVSGDPRILEILWPATHTEPLQSSLP